jgi:hypothetical protein
MMFLTPSHYYVVEPEKWLLDQGIESEVGRDLVILKLPSFSYDSELSSVRSADNSISSRRSVFSHANVRQMRKCLA